MSMKSTDSHDAALPFTDRVGLVTGAGSGIGRAVAHDLSQFGASVYIIDIDGDAARGVRDEIIAMGGAAVAVTADICDTSRVNEVVAQIGDDAGRIDILVNVAGFNAFATPEQTTREHWDSIIGVNLTGAWNVASAVMRIMMQRRYGRIVNIGSAAGMLGIPMAIPYTAAKHGVVGLTRALAVDLAPYNITVNCVAPGPIDSPLFRAQTGSDFLQQSIARIPLGRIGQPMDVARAVRFFASGDAEWITGTALPVDGGLVSVIRAHHWE